MGRRSPMAFSYGSMDGASCIIWITAYIRKKEKRIIHSRFAIAPPFPLALIVADAGAGAEPSSYGLVSRQVYSTTAQSRTPRW